MPGFSPRIARFSEYTEDPSTVAGEFVGRTGQPWWAAAASRDHRLELQPLRLLTQRAILATTVRHELVRVAQSNKIISTSRFLLDFIVGLAEHRRGMEN